MMLSLPELDHSLRTKQFAVVYLLLGEETYLRRTAIDRIVAARGAALEIPLQPQRLHARETPVAQLLERAQTVDMFTSHQLLIAENIDAWKAESLTTLATWVAAPTQGVTLILTADKLDGRQKAAKLLQEHASVVACKPLYPREVPAWVRMECCARGLTIDSQAAQLLADIGGTELGVIAQALDQLRIAAGASTIIDAALIEQQLLHTTTHDVFALTNAVAKRDRAHAIAMLTQLLARGEVPLVIVSLLVRHWRLVMHARTFLDDHARADPAALARHLKVHPFFVKDYLQHAERTTRRKLASGLRQLARADRTLKSSRLPATSVLTRVVLGL